MQTQKSSLVSNKTRFSKIALSVFALLIGSANCHYSEIKDMRNYENEYRYMTCNECFQSNGYFCHVNDMMDHIDIPYDNLQGHSICCKPGTLHPKCQSNSYQSCSKPAIQSPSSSAILSPGGRDHQMFAYNMQTNEKMCGISQYSNLDMGVEARFESKTISASKLRYIEANRQYDSCYYEITANQDEVKYYLQHETDQTYLRSEIQLTLSKNLNMNVYLYGGKTRETATESIVEDNLPIEIGQTYSIDYTKGMLLVAYPKQEELNTDFEFTYQIKNIYQEQVAEKEQSPIVEKKNEAQKKENNADKIVKFFEQVKEKSQEGLQIIKTETGVKEDSHIHMIVGGILGFLFVSCVLCCCRKRKDNKVEVSLAEKADQMNQLPEELSKDDKKNVAIETHRNQETELEIQEISDVDNDDNEKAKANKSNIKPAVFGEDSNVKRLNDDIEDSINYNSIDKLKASQNKIPATGVRGSQKYPTILPESISQNPWKDNNQID